MGRPLADVRADFDRLAHFSTAAWDHNSQCHGFLLRRLPPGCGEALEIGCGTGAFSRLLAARCERVLALDLSPEMIRLARERSSHCPNIDYQVADALSWEWPAGRFDCVASIATLHHLPMEDTLGRMGRALRSGGVLLALDLPGRVGPAGLFMTLAALPLALLLELVRNRRLRRPRAERDAWTDHGRHDTCPSLAEVRRACAAALPGARVRLHLLWRYSIVWNKPS